MMALNKQKELFEERVVNLFREIVLASEDVSNLFQKNNILVKLEIFTYLFWVQDYSLVLNRVDPAVRSEINKMFNEMFKYSHNWNTVRLKIQDHFIDDRLNNYTKIIRTANTFSMEYYERIMEYQIDLISWILKKDEVCVGFIGVSEKKQNYQPIELGVTSRHNIKVPLQEAYIGILLPLISRIKRNTNISYFIDRQYKL